MRCLAAVFSLAIGGLAGAVDLPPQAIRSPLPMTPLEAGDLPTPPTATVELTVSPRGLVTRVQVTSMHPVTPMDDMLRAEIKDTLGTWRFAPAVREGKFAEAVAKMQIQFARVDQERVDLRRGSMYAPGFVGADDPRAAAWAWRIDALDPSAFLEQRKQALATANELIPAGRQRVQDVPHFQVVTDTSKPESPAILARNLEAVYTTLGGLFAKVGPFERARAPLTAYVFDANRTLQQSFAAQKAGIMFEPAGYYNPLGLVLFHLEMPNTESLLRVLMHETTHAFVHRHLVRRGVRIPTWLDEGLAEYVGNSDVVAGKLKPGSHKAYSLYHAGVDVWRARSMTSVDASTVKTAIKNGTSLPVAKLLGTSASRFYGSDWSLFYTQSWLLVHFLRHGKPGWSETQFPAFLLYAAEGFAAEDVIAQVYGLQGDALEQAYRAYVRKF
jgi:hypothetical protein